jgi:hypothetical protein
MGQGQPPLHPYRMAWNILPVVVKLKPGAISVSQRQYYIPWKVQIEIQKHLDRLPPCSHLNYCYFTPCGPKPIHAFGPYLSWAKFFVCLDLKDTFFCICLTSQSQPIFAFQWESPSTGEKGQLTGIWLLQCFKNSSTVFGTALASNLKAFSVD